MQTLIIVIHLMVVTGMVCVVLLQRSEGGGLGMGSGGGFLTSRGTANVLTRTTAVLAGIFFATSLLLSILAGLDRKPRSIIPGAAPAGQQRPGTLPPISQPGGGGGVLDTLRQGAQPPTQAPAPQPPAAPQVPQSQ